MTTISENLSAVKARIAAACERSRRDPSTVALVAVSKKQPLAAIREAYAVGARVFGENYVQELVDKADTLALPEHAWHFIGHLQTNKARLLVGRTSLVHGVDRIELALELDKRAAVAGRRVGVLLQVNLAGEDTKSGCDPDALRELVAEANARPNLDVRGLMTMPPAVADPEDARPWFRALRELRDGLGDARLVELSMGMSHDFEVAIEEGATLVRIGTAIFGARGGSGEPRLGT